MKFLNCKINTSKNVFRPRTETEFWVKEAVGEIKKKDTKDGDLRILDIFSGSGCIGISVLRNIGNSMVDFVDIWEESIEQIKINLKLNKISDKRYRVYHSNLFDELKGGKYDYIFANPPYVALDRIKEVQKEVLEKDPKVALFAGRDGMAVIREFLAQVKEYLKSDGRIFMEFDPLQQNEIEKIVNKERLNGNFRKDQFGKIRWAAIVR